MAQKRYLAFDLGAESGRAIAGILENGRLTLDEVHRFPTLGLQIYGSLRWNVYRFFEEILTGIKKYVQKYGPEVESIGVDTWGVDFGLVDASGELLGLPYHYRDLKNVGSEKLLDEKLGNARIYELTGIQFLPFNTLNQIAEMAGRKDAKLNKAAHILFIADLLHYFLTGALGCEYTAASISQMYNAVKGDWEDEIFQAFGIPGALKSRVVYAGDTVGVLFDSIADETGLKRGVKVIAPAVHDTASAAVAVPALKDDGWAYLSSGTWSVLGFELDHLVINQESFEMSLSNSGGAFKKNILLKNVMGLWIIQQCRRSWNKTWPDLSYPEMEAKAAEAPEFAAYINVDDPSFLNPEDMPAAVVNYLKRTGQGDFDPKDVGGIARLVLEGLAFKYRFVLERLMKATGRNADVLHVLGGGGKNELLNRLTANTLNMRVTAGPVEATAIGNVMMQAYGSGEYKSLAEIRRAISDSFELKEYLPDCHAKWELNYKKYLLYL